MNTFKGAYGYKVVRVSEQAPSMSCAKPEVAEKYWREVITKQEWFDEEKEHLVVLLLNTRYDVKGFNMVSVGTVNESIAHPREVFRAAVASSAYAIILMHNHPSGDPSPSPADHAITRRFKECAEILQIKLIDHIVIGRADLGAFDMAKQRGIYSFKEAGIL